MSTAKSHVVEVVVGRFDTEQEQAKTVERLEAAYAKLRKRAIDENMVVLSSMQTCEHLAPFTICYTITVNWISRDELEALQRQQALLRGMPAGGMN